MDKNYGNDYFNNPENTANTDNKTDVGSVNNADTSNYGRTDNTTSYSSSAQNPYATSNTAQSSSGTTGYSDNIYSSQGSQAQGSNSSGSGFLTRTATIAAATHQLTSPQARMMPATQVPDI